MPELNKTQRRMHALQKQKKEIEGQLIVLSSRRRFEKRKAEDRLKWLLGSLVFDRFSHEPALQELVRRELPNRLTKRDQERGISQIIFNNQKESLS